jgi:hypothetical protein
MMLVGAIAILAATFTLRLRDRETVAVRWLGIDLPPICASRWLLGVECPGCGLTRSFVALASGQLSQSLTFHRLGWLLAVAVAAQIPYRVFALWELRYREPQRAWPIWFAYLIVAVFVVDWLLKSCGR